MSWRIVPLLMLVVGLAHFNRVSIAVAGTEQIIRPDFISKTQMGLVYSSFLLLYTLFMIPGGWFSDRFGPRAGWMILVFGGAAGVALTGLVGLAFTAAVPLLLGLLVVRSVMGVTNVPLHPSAARLVANWVPPEGVALANGLVTFAACVGMASTYVVFGMLIDHYGWPQAFLICSGVTLLVALVWALASSDHPPGRRGVIPPAPPRSDPGGFTRLLSNPSLLCLTLSYGAVGYFQYLFFYWAEHYFEEVRELTKEASRGNSSLLVLAMGAGMILGGWLSDRAVARFGTRRGLAVVPVAGLLLGGIANVVGVFTSDPVLIISSFAVAMAAVGACEGPFWTASVRLGGVRGTTAAAILNTGGNGVGLLAPIVTPAVADVFGWQVSLVLASIVCVVGAALWWGIDPAAAPDDALH
jgi:MFS family permease